jgi:hypothetical protein
MAIAIVSHHGVYTQKAQRMTYTCEECKSRCHIAWYNWLFLFQRPTIFKWRQALGGGWLCPQHDSLTYIARAKYLRYSDYDTI